MLAFAFSFLYQAVPNLRFARSWIRDDEISVDRGVSEIELMASVGIEPRRNQCPVGIDSQRSVLDEGLTCWGKQIMLGRS